MNVNGLHCNDHCSHCSYSATVPPTTSCESVPTTSYLSVTVASIQSRNVFSSDAYYPLTIPFLLLFFLTARLPRPRQTLRPFLLLFTFPNISHLVCCPETETYNADWSVAFPTPQSLSLPSTAITQNVSTHVDHRHPFATTDKASLISSIRKTSINVGSYLVLVKYCY